MQLDTLWPKAFRDFSRNICPTKGTGEWVRNRPKFQAWEIGKNRKLWIHGQPAAGKTYLAKHIINRTRGTPGVQVLECFLSARCIERNTCEAILRSTMYQLVKNNLELLTRLVDRSTTTTLEQLTELWQNLMAEVLENGSSIVLVIDGFDEISHKEQEEFLECLEACENKLSSSARRHIRIVILSRWCRSLQQAKREFSIYKMDELDNTEDIRRTVTKELETFAEEAGYSKRFQMEVCDHITRGANGIYLWATIMVSDIGIRMPLEHQLQAQLQRLPKSLAELYDYILDNIDSDLQEIMTKRVLLWVVFCLEPLKLKELNLAIALAELWEQNPSGPIDSKEIDKCMIPPHLFKAVLVRICGQLLRLSASNHVEPVHRTLSQFLTTNPQALAGENWKVPNHARFYMDKGKSHAAIGRMCAAYLMMNSFESAGERFDSSPERQTRWEIKVQTRIGSHGLVQYSALCWSRHLTFAGLIPGEIGDGHPITVALRDLGSEFAISWLEVWWFLKKWRDSNFLGCPANLDRAMANDGHSNTLIPQVADHGTADPGEDDTTNQRDSTDALGGPEEKAKEGPGAAHSQATPRQSDGTSVPVSTSEPPPDWSSNPTGQRREDVRNTTLYHSTTINTIIYNE